MSAKRVGIFNQPATRSSKRSKPGEPWQFKPSMADQRAGPAVGAGTYWGTGVKNPQGRMRDSSVGYRPVSPSQMSKPPKKLA